MLLLHASRPIAQMFYCAMERGALGAAAPADGRSRRRAQRAPDQAPPRRAPPGSRRRPGAPAPPRRPPPVAQRASLIAYFGHPARARAPRRSRAPRPPARRAARRAAPAAPPRRPACAPPAPPPGTPGEGTRVPGPFHHAWRGFGAFGGVESLVQPRCFTHYTVICRVLMSMVTCPWLVRMNVWSVKTPQSNGQ